MDNNKEEEKKYIIKKLYESERRHKLKDYNLEKNTYVKYIVPKDGKKDSKHRYQVSPEYYKIIDKNGHAYVIAAKDGSTLTLSRWRLLPVKTTEGLKYARSVNGGKKGIITEITDFVEGWKDPKTKRKRDVYVVKWKSPEDEEILTHEPIGMFKRERKRLNKLTKHEAAYWKGKTVPRKIFARR
jgi:hypothetical protein